MTENDLKIIRFWGHFRSFFPSKLNFVSPEWPIYVFYDQMSATSLFLVHFLTLEYILEPFQAVLAKIFKKNRQGGKKGGVFSPLIVI